MGHGPRACGFTADSIPSKLPGGLGDKKLKDLL